MRRRDLVLTALASGLRPALAQGADAAVFAEVTPRPLAFPRDHGAHPAHRLEWWYLTGWLDAPEPTGFQVTFFRTRTPLGDANPSRFAARQLVIAHAALAQPARGHLLHDQRVARTGFGIAQAAEADTDVAVDRWQLVRRADGRYDCRVAARAFTLEFTARPTQPLLLQGEAGFSRKGPSPAQASHYYSQPQLAIDAQLTVDSARRAQRGTAWLDHEWSTSLLPPDAAGWDWIGMNLDGGGALTAFRIRRRDGGADAAPLYAYASLRESANAPVQVFGADAVRFETLDTWESPRTRARYPVAQRVTVGARRFETRPLMPDQELDSRASTGAVYWEGASTLLEDGRTVGRGYLEMTGYAAPFRP